MDSKRPDTGINDDGVLTGRISSREAAELRGPERDRLPVFLMDGDGALEKVGSVTFTIEDVYDPTPFDSSTIPGV